MFLTIDRRKDQLNRASRDQAAEKGRSHPAEGARPRARAKDQAKTIAPETGVFRSLEETRRLLCELQLREVELEIKNVVLRRAGSEEKAALEMYRSLYDLAPAGYLTFGPDGVIKAANLTVASLFGIDRSRLLGQRFGSFVAYEARPVFRGFLGRVFANQGKDACELPLLKVGKLPSFIQMETVTAASGGECHAVIIDISARRGQEREQEARNGKRVAQLEEANAELEAFSFTVSHDLCTPLASITGFSQVLLTLCEDQLDEKAKGYLQGVSDGTLRMKWLIASLLDFSRVARVGLRRETVDLSAVAHAVAGELKQTQPEGRGRFVIADGVTVNGDAGLCRVVLDNLIGNAWKHSARGADTVIEFGRTELGGKPVFFVCDNGPGFDVAHAGQLFMPFQRIPGTEPQGHGIGLSTVKRIVQRHGGRVWAESSPGEGATFFFTLE
jgi:PAS domain S-box-containing protein